MSVCHHVAVLSDSNEPFIQVVDQSCNNELCRFDELLLVAVLKNESMTVNQTCEYYHGSLQK